MSATTSIATVACRGAMRVTRASITASTSGRTFVRVEVSADDVVEREMDSMGCLVEVLLELALSGV